MRAGGHLPVVANVPDGVKASLHNSIQPNENDLNDVPVEKITTSFRWHSIQPHETRCSEAIQRWGAHTHVTQLCSVAFIVVWDVYAYPPRCVSDCTFQGVLAFNLPHHDESHHWLLFAEAVRVEREGRLRCHRERERACVKGREMAT